MRGPERHKGVDGVKTVSRVPGRKRPGTCFFSPCAEADHPKVVIRRNSPYIADC